MNVELEMVTPVFAWSWDPRSEWRVYADNEKKDYSYIINYDGHSEADTKRSMREYREKEETNKKKADQDKHFLSLLRKDHVLSIYSDEELLQKFRASELANHYRAASIEAVSSSVPTLGTNSHNISNEEEEQQQHLQSASETDSTQGLDAQFDHDDDENNVCGICRANYNGTCPTCKIPGDSCPLIIGKCKHFFHYHCIIRWLKTPHSKCLCPMCRRTFEVKPYYMVNDPIRFRFYKTMKEELNEHLGTNEDLAFWCGYRDTLEDSSGLIDELIKKHMDQLIPVRDVLHLRPKALKSPWRHKTKNDNEKEDDINKKSNHSDSSSSDDSGDELDEEDKELLETLKYDYKAEARTVNRKVLKLCQREKKLRNSTSQAGYDYNRYTNYSDSSSSEDNGDDSDYDYFYSKHDPGKFICLKRDSAPKNESPEWTSADYSASGPSV